MVISDDFSTYQSRDDAAMADVNLVSEGTHSPGNMYSLMNPGLRL